MTEVRACEHYWVSLGCSTICEPPIRHEACGRCRTFRHTQLHSSLAEWLGSEPKPDYVWYDDEWVLGPFDWKDIPTGAE
jgi:hypothetical protein